MNRLLDSDLHDESPTGDHEISLSVPTILGIFFALALVCAVFFGFGYTMGRKSAQNAAASTATIAGSHSITLKPTADQPATSAAHPVLVDTTPPAAAEPSVTVPLSAPKSTPADSTIVGDKQPATGNLQPATSPTGNFMVQIAAVSSQEIADIEVAALKKYGYDVVVRHEPQDQLLHIQIGPYATRKDADAMRANVQAHGFNAIVK